jgi:hypothetical protein
VRLEVRELRYPRTTKKVPSELARDRRYGVIG